MFGLPIIAVIAFITAFTVSLITASVHIIRQPSGKSFDGDITFPDKQVDADDIQEIDTHVCDQISKSSYIKVKQYSYQDSSHKIRRTVWGLTFGDLDIDDDAICQIDHCPYCGKRLL